MVVLVRTCGKMWCAWAKLPGFIQSGYSVRCCLPDAVTLLVRLSWIVVAVHTWGWHVRTETYRWTPSYLCLLYLWLSVLQTRTQRDFYLKDNFVVYECIDTKYIQKIINILYFVRQTFFIWTKIAFLWYRTELCWLENKRRQDCLCIL